jgi:hypothetical protein
MMPAPRPPDSGHPTNAPRLVSEPMSRRTKVPGPRNTRMTQLSAKVTAKPDGPEQAKESASPEASRSAMARFR